MRNNFLKALPLLINLISLILICDNGQAQCCSAGNPFFYGEQANIGHKQLQIIAGYKYSQSDQYYHEDSKADIDFIDKAYFNYLNLQIIYGLTPKFSFQTDLGYFVNRTEQYKKEDWKTINGYGIGDAGLTIKYQAYSSFSRKISIIPSVGVKFPIGVFDQEVDHVKLPITVQPSSGSFKYLLNLYLSKTFRKSKFNLGFFGSAEFPQLIDSENFYYKYGNMYLFSFVGSYYLNDDLTLGFEIRNENRNKATRENDQIVESSGYNIVYVVPHISFAFAKQWFIAINADIPVYKYYNGIQLANKFAISARLSYHINFDKEVLKEVEINKH
jgi:hypothetical protein